MKKFFLLVYSKIIYFIFSWILIFSEVNALNEFRGETSLMWGIPNSDSTINIFKAIVEIIFLVIYWITWIFLLAWIYFFLTWKRNKARKLKWKKYIQYSFSIFVISYILYKIVIWLWEIII